MADEAAKEMQSGDEIMYPGWSTLTKKEWEQLEKELDFRYGATSVRLPRSWNPIVRLYEFFLDLYV